MPNSGGSYVTTRISCTVASADTLDEYAYCPCAEINEKGDTLSSGMYKMDMKTRRPYKYDWHIYKDSGLYYHRHYTLLTVADSLVENLNQTICLNADGDTIRDKSDYIAIQAPELIHLGEEFVAKFRYMTTETMETHFEVSKLTHYDSLINISKFDALRNDAGNFEFRCIPEDTGHYEMNTKIIAVPLRDEVDTSRFATYDIYYFYDFVVIP